MEQSLGLQSSQFLLSAVLGLAYGIHFDFLRGLGRNLRWLRHLLDFWFALTFLLGNLLFALYVGNGEYRIFMLAGTGLGILAYFFTLSRPFSRFFDLFWRILTLPLRFLGKIFRRFLKKLQKFAKNIFSNGKKSGTMKEQRKRKLRHHGTEEDLHEPAKIVTHYQADHFGSHALRNDHPGQSSA